MPGNVQVIVQVVKESSDGDLLTKIHSTASATELKIAGLERRPNGRGTFKVIFPLPVDAKEGPVSGTDRADAECRLDVDFR